MWVIFFELNKPKYNKNKSKNMIKNIFSATLFLIKNLYVCTYYTMYEQL